VQGSLGGEYLRRSLDLVSWEAAQDRVRGWEASGEVGVIKAAVPTISEAIARFFEDAEARGLAEATIGKLNVLLRKQLLPWCRSKGYLSLKQLTVDELTQFRATWPDSAISKYKKQERLKSFFHFCVAREWVRTNPVIGLGCCCPATPIPKTKLKTRTITHTTLHERQELGGQWMISIEIDCRNIPLIV
jgi:hypothetical protein